VESVAGRVVVAVVVSDAVVTDAEVESVVVVTDVVGTVPVVADVVNPVVLKEQAASTKANKDRKIRKGIFFIRNLFSWCAFLLYTIQVEK